MKTHALTGSVLMAALAVVNAGSAPASDEEPAADAQRVMAKGTFVRIGYNDEGWVTLGYRTANHSVGEEWMVLEVGVTLQQGVSGQTLRRSDIALLTPDGKVVTLASQEDFREAGYLTALNRRASVARDPVDYFPASVRSACRLSFFANPTGDSSARLAQDELELGSQRACVGRLYFHLPDGIGLGPYTLGVKFTRTMVRVPFRIMTKDEAKELKKKLDEKGQ
ncbi:MAG: hypothetical protein LJF30_21055 [Acidobacteria bacterium]|jgi:uncharacterized membrane protein|nr:hypothetical protein [Acidobacteriota bacterium]